MRQIMFQVFLAGYLSLAATLSSAQTAAPVALPIDNAQLIGEGRLSYLFWDVYDAALYAPGGVWHPERPYALTLRYLLDISGKDIAERSIEEMRKQGQSNARRLTRWQQQMQALFPDVSEGTELTGIYRPGEATRFYHNGMLAGAIDDPEFGPAFFNIWLSPDTSEPTLRQQLLGLQ